MILSDWEIRAVVSQHTARAKAHAAIAFDRPVLGEVLAACELNDSRAVVVHGPRRVGKTWLIQSAMVRVGHAGLATWYCDFTDPRLGETTMRAVIDALGIEPGDRSHRLFLDEIHFVEDWARELAALVNEDRAQLIIADSAASMLQHGLAVAALDRIVTITVAPLGFSEVASLAGAADAPRSLHAWTELQDRYLIFGGFPIAAPLARSDPYEAHRLLRHMVQQTVDKDIGPLLGLRNPQDLATLALALVSRSRDQWSWKRFEETAGVSGPTVKKWWRPLQRSGLLHVLRAHRSDPSASHRVSPKVYACDPGLVAACTPTTDWLADTTIRGRLFETAVANALVRMAQRLNMTLSFYQPSKNSKKQGECDFLLKRGDDKWLVEVTASDSASGKVGTLAKLRHELNAKGAVVVCDAGRSSRQHGVRVEPLWRFLSDPDEALR